MENILSGGIAELEQLRAVLENAEATKSERDAAQVQVKQLEKELATLKKNIKDEKESTVKKRRQEIESRFNNEISKENAKLKKSQSERGKAKAAGVKERIAGETSDLTTQNADYKEAIRKIVKQEKMPFFCGTKYYYTMFYTKGIDEVLIFILSVLIGCVLIPGGVGFALANCVPAFSGHLPLVMAITFVVFLALEIFLYIMIGRSTKSKHGEKLKEIREIRNSIKNNGKQIDKISKSIRDDKSEEMYNLGDFDSKISSSENVIRGMEEEKSQAIKRFDTEVAPQLEQDIESRELPRVNELEASLAEKTARLECLDQAVKENNIRITTDYEAYLGKNHCTLQGVNALIGRLQSGDVATVGEAINSANEGK